MFKNIVQTIHIVKIMDYITQALHLCSIYCLFKNTLLQKYSEHYIKQQKNTGHITQINSLADNYIKKTKFNND